MADDHPLTVFFGGQPGAGKTMGQRRIEAMHPGEHLVKIIGDDLRQFHPDYTRLVEEAPLDMPSETAHASGMWIGMGVAEANAKGYSIVIEGTWRNPATVLDEARKAKQLGRRTHAVALAVQPSASLISILERYYKDRLAGRPSRWTPLDAHDRTIMALPGTVAQVAADPAVDRLTVMNRYGEVLFDGVNRATRMDEGVRAWHDAFTKPISLRERRAMARQLELVERGHAMDDEANAEVDDAIWATRQSLSPVDRLLSLAR